MKRISKPGEMSRHIISYHITEWNIMLRDRGHEAWVLVNIRSNSAQEVKPCPGGWTQPRRPYLAQEAKTGPVGWNPNSGQEDKLGWRTGGRMNLKDKFFLIKIFHHNLNITYAKNY